MKTRILHYFKKTSSILLELFLVIILIVSLSGKGIKDFYTPNVSIMAIDKDTYITREVDLDLRLTPQRTFTVYADTEVNVESIDFKSISKVWTGNVIGKVKAGYQNKNKQNDEEIVVLEKTISKIKLLKDAMKKNSLEYKELISLLQNQISNTNSTEVLQPQEIIEKKIEISNLNLEIDKIGLSITDYDRQIIELNRKIDSLKYENQNSESDMNLSSWINSSGEIISKYDGYIVKSAQEGIIGEREFFMDFSPVDNINRLMFETTVSESDGVNFELGKSYFVNYLDNKLQLKLTSYEKISETVELKFEIEKGDLYLLPYNTIHATIQMDKVKYDYVIPSGALILDDPSLGINAMGHIYLVENKEGVFGKAWVVRKINVVVRDFTDSEIAIDSPESIENKMLVLDPRGKIKSGVSVKIQ